jgi:hypothetical protein
MRIVFEIFFGLLYVSCMLVCCRYFWNDNLLKQYEEQLDYYLETLEST